LLKAPRRLLVGVVVGIMAVACWVVPVAAQQPGDEGDRGESTTSSVTAVPGQDIIPDPNSGQAPEEAGDRGGALQLLLLVLIVVGLGVIAWRIAVSARRHETSSGAPGSSRT
jgi:hypothetical protein